MPAESSSPALPPVPGTVPGYYARLLHGYLAAHGHDAQAMLGEPAGAAQDMRSIPAARWRLLLERAAEALGDPALGLHVGATVTPSHLGPLGYVLQSSSSTAAALARYIRYQRLVHDVSPVRHMVEGDTLVLEWSAESRTVGLLVNQCGMAALYRFARQLVAPATAPPGSPSGPPGRTQGRALDTAAALTPRAVHFVEAAPADTAPYAATFGCPVLFGQPATRIVFPLALLQQPVRQPDPALAAMLEQQVQAMFAALPARDSLEGSTCRLLAGLLVNGEPALDRVAAALGVSGRTLRRQLAAQGLSYRALLEATRQRMAQDFLMAGELGLAEIALLLGYSEQSAFNRAVRRWSGMAPRQWQQALRLA